ncbi:hypothetical protein ANCCEY_04643 [Ancylostoma ceylanicum]|uniref:Uncharacterized protein n=1 Tax=Ancylostoma ceylanicum TaxID=53326 RepID=A0A0D6M1S3_9BILA|nr:hypothetical protein ANCCEY_04643 [Ancylostoma ceylanicum]
MFDGGFGDGFGYGYGHGVGLYYGAMDSAMVDGVHGKIGRRHVNTRNITRILPAASCDARCSGVWYKLMTAQQFRIKLKIVVGVDNFVYVETNAIQLQFPIEWEAV